MTDPCPHGGHEPPRGDLPPKVRKAAQRIHRAVWGESYVPGRGPMHHAGGSYWRGELLRLADSWERMAKAARICANHLPGPMTNDGPHGGLCDARRRDEPTTGATAG